MCDWLNYRTWYFKQIILGVFSITLGGPQNGSAYGDKSVSNKIDTGVVETIVKRNVVDGLKNKLINSWWLEQISAEF